MGSIMIAAHNAVPLICSFVQCVRSKNLLGSSANSNGEHMPRYASPAKGLLVTTVARHIRQVRMLSRRTQPLITIARKAANSLLVLLQDVGHKDQEAILTSKTFSKCLCGIVGHIATSSQANEPFFSRECVFKMPVRHCSQHRPRRLQE